MVLSLLVRERGDDSVNVVFSGLCYALDGIFPLEREWYHDLVRKPSFLHFTEPARGFYLVSDFRYRLEFPQLLVIERVRVLSSLEEYTFHCGQVVLETVIYTGHESRP